MKYETPELNPVPAERAIQNSIPSKELRLRFDAVAPGNPVGNEFGHGYVDWE